MCAWVRSAADHLRLQQILLLAQELGGDRLSVERDAELALFLELALFMDICRG